MRSCSSSQYLECLALAIRSKKSGCSSTLVERGERKKERGESDASFSSCPVALISLNASDFRMLMKYVVWHEERSSNQSLPSPTAEIAALFPSKKEWKEERIRFRV